MKLEIMHPFFTDIQKHPLLVEYCDLEKKELPGPYKGKNGLKAILLGADPTNSGLKKGDNPLQIKTVFGIGEYNDVFFRPQLININAIGLNKENLYIQNVCRNYFNNETSDNKKWREIAEIWLPYLKKELNEIDQERILPVLVTSEIIMKALVDDVCKASEVYKNCLSYQSNVLERKIFALYRHPRYSLSLKSDSNNKYRNFLIAKFK